MRPRAYGRTAGSCASGCGERKARHVVCLLSAFALVLGSVFAAGCSSEPSSSESTLSEISEVFDASLLDLEYSDRDQDASYDGDSATLISLEEDSADIDGDGASVDGSTITIAQEGTYVVSGSLDDGQLVVEAGDSEKVQVVLADASIHNEDGPAIYVKEADKCFITLADGTENTLTDGESYELEEDSDEPYATLFSRADLTINGTGVLCVTSSYRHAVCSKDDLVITGGTYVIDATEDALRGRDCVKILDGTFSITAGGDGIKSNKDDDAERGFVSIDGGAFSITAGDEAVQAVTYLRIAGGTFDVSADDDAFHSDLEMLIAGGTLEVQAGDDAFHAETVLTVEDGDVDVSSCYEGYEAEKIYINGATTHIVASDDAINASAADLSDDDSDSTSDTTSDAGVAGSGTSNAEGADGFSDTGDFSGRGAPDGHDDAADDAGASDATAGSAMPLNEASGANAGQGASDDGDGDSAGAGEDVNERAMNGGAPDGAFAETGGGATMGDENCLVQISGGYTVLDASGDGVDSNGSVEIAGGVLLVSGPESGDDGAFDYDISASVSGGTVIMVGSAGMAQNFTEGTQAFAFANVSGSAGDNIAVVDSSGQVLASFTSSKGFATALVTCPGFEEDGTYELVVGGSVSDGNEDGYAESSTVSGGSSTQVTASTTATGGLGGLGADGNPMGAGEAGGVQTQRRQSF